MDKQNGKKTTVALYLLLALIIVSVIALTVFSVASNRRKDNVVPKETKAAETARVKTPETRASEPIPPVTEPEREHDEAPETDSDRASDDKGFVCVQPVAGYLLKAYSADMPTFSLTMNDYRTHTGIDVLSDPGSPVMAFSDGKISGVYNDPMMGNCVSVEHSNGIVSYYMGLSDERPEEVFEGAPVYCGQVIGSVGDSTLVEISEDSHLHFELRQNGKLIDPTTYVSYEPVNSDTAVAGSYED